MSNRMNLSPAPLGVLKPLSLRVLCVDDHPDTADTVATLLSLTGANARPCYDGRTALDLAREFQPEVAVLDVNMPDVDGCDLARRLHSFPDGGPLLVALTAAESVEALERMAAAGFDYHLAKPLDFARLVAVLQDYKWQRGVKNGRPVETHTR